MANFTGGSLTGFTDTYLKAREQFSREDERQSIANYRALQAQRLQADMDAEGAVSSPETQEIAASLPPPGERELAPAVPGTPEQPSTVGPTPGAQPAAPGPQGGMAPDADLGNRPANITATPGTPATPGAPAVTHRVRTFEDGVKAFGAKRFGQLQRTEAGRAMLKGLGYTSDAELQQRRTMAETDQEMKVLVPRIQEMIAKGDAVGVHNAKAAMLQRMAEKQSDPAIKRHYQDLAIKEQDMAAAGMHDKVVSQEAGELYRQQLRTLDAWRKDPTDTGKFEQLSDVVAEMKKNKMTASTADTFTGNIDKVIAAVYGKNADPQYQATMQLQTAFGKAKADNPTMRNGALWQKVLSEHPELYAPTVSDAIHSGDSERMRAYGLNPIAHLKNPFEVASALVEGQGIPYGDPRWPQAFQAAYAGLHQAKTSADALRLYGPGLRSDLSSLQRDFKEAQRELKDISLQKGEHSPEYTAKTREIEEIRQRMQHKQAAIDQLEGTKLPGGGGGAPKPAAAPKAGGGGPPTVSESTPLRQEAVAEAVGAVTSKYKTRTEAQKKLREWFNSSLLTLKEYNLAKDDPRVLKLPLK